MSEHELFESVELARSHLTALRARLEHGEDGPGFRGMVGALGELQSLLDKLHARYGLLREILDRTEDLVFAKHRDGRYAMVNIRGADILGRAIDEIVGANDQDLFGSAEAERIMIGDREVMRTGEPHTREMTIEVRGLPVTLLATTTAWYDGRRTLHGVIGIAHDVTERRRIEREVSTRDDRMRAMASELVVSEEQLRRALAAELHNGLGQDIALAKMKLSMLRSSADQGLHESLSGIEQLVEQADRSLRSITYQISPPSLHDLGLVAALQWLGEDIGMKHGLRVRIEDDHSPSVTDERVRVILFRAVRELLIRAANEPSVREARVRISAQESLVSIRVEYTGAHLIPYDIDRHRHDLFGVGEHLKYVGGSMVIASASDSVTIVTLTAPAPMPEQLLAT